VEYGKKFQKVRKDRLFYSLKDSPNRTPFMIIYNFSHNQHKYGHKKAAHIARLFRTYQ
tara:strand:- start:13554 stop:13727 length:174 start_codon:yes stop_codon:yes gene_type:complete